MTAPGALGHVWIIGPGRLGLALGSALLSAGAAERVSVSGRAASAPEHPLFTSPDAGYLPLAAPPPDGFAGVLLAVPDGAVAETAGWLAERRIPPVPALHTSGVLGVEPLRKLAARGAATGSLHPLVSVADPTQGTDALLGAWYGIEGAPAAIRWAEAIVAGLGGRVIHVGAEGKPLYHAAAVFAANYAVAILAVAERLMTAAGVPADEVRPALTTLAAGAVANVAAVGPLRALTGPVARGDAETIDLHLARLSPRERLLYSVLASETLELARARGIPAERAERIAALLQPGAP
jgi:predicted short-subunit dehydrogenase-like oxidoreductase (DUF2520 family)